MFGSNGITGQKHFKDAPMNSLQVTSIFFTLQGEGPLAGRAAVFVRLTGCNLACSFCDTYFEKGEWLTFDEIEQRARRLVSDVRGKKEDEESNSEFSFFDDDIILVITGGEPTLQPNLAGFLLSQMGKWCEVQIETNGLIERQFPIGMRLVVSPKSTEPALPKNLKQGHYLKPPPGILERADCLKFVVDANPLSVYYKPPQWAHLWMLEMQRPLFISPMNIYKEGEPMRIVRDREDRAKSLTARTANERLSFWTSGLLDRERNQQNHEYAAMLCMKQGYRLTLQTHLYASLP